MPIWARRVSHQKGQSRRINKFISCFWRRGPNKTGTFKPFSILKICCDQMIFRWNMFYQSFFDIVFFSQQDQLPEVFCEERYSWIFYRSHWKIFVVKSLFNNVASIQACNFIKKRSQHRSFPVKFVKCLRTPTLNAENVARRKSSAEDCAFLLRKSRTNCRATLVKSKVTLI